MRGLAAICVALIHVPELKPFVSGGYLAVDLFFVLSGFVICSAYEDRLAADLHPGKFLLIRLVRFYPMYVMGLAIGFAGALVHAWHGSIGHLGTVLLGGLAYLLFLPQPIFATKSLYLFNRPMWSLFFELLINAVYAVFLRRLSQRWLIGFVAVNGLLLSFCVVAAGRANFGVSPDQFLPGLIRTAFSFSVGVLIYRSRDRIKMRLHPMLLLPAIGLLLTAPIPSGVARILWDFMCVGIAFPVLIAFGANCRNVPRFVPLLAMLGAMSYPLYAIHNPMLRLAAPPLEHLLLLPGWLMGLSVVLLLVAICPFLERVYERPARCWLTAQLDRLWNTYFCRSGGKEPASESGPLPARADVIAVAESQGPTPDHDDNRAGGRGPLADEGT
jgi:peptidoglycan/LPS O-acetylase OafA/YrhL